MLHTSILRWVAIAGVVLFAGRALAVGGTHTTLAHFQAHTRGDALFDAFSGSSMALASYSAGGAPGYGFTVTTTGLASINRDTSGLSNSSESQGLRVLMTGRAATAFAGKFRVLNALGTPVAGTVSLVTDTGEVFITGVTAAGTFLGFTTTQPFGTVTVDTVPPGSLFEAIDDMYVGSSATAAVAGDQCADAPTVGVGAYAFYTPGAIRDLNTSSCNVETTSPDVYFRFVAPATGLVTASTCGCSFDSILRVFTACGSGGGGGGTEIACNDDFCAASVGGNVASLTQFRMTGGQAVFIRIAGYQGNSGGGTLTISEQADCAGDANHSGGLEVQDVFDFLNAWFAGCP